MLKLLVAVDGSECSTRLADYVIAQARRCSEPLEVHLLTVQLPLVGVNVKLFISRDDLDAYYRDEGTSALKNTRQSLDTAEIKYAFHIGLGNPAEVILQYAEEKRCEQIIMGTRGLGSVSSLVLGSVANKVLHLAKVPVVLIK